MSENHRKRAWLALAAIAGVGAVATASAQPPEFVRAEQQRKAFVRAEASSKAKAPAQPANEAEAVKALKLLPGGIIEIPLPADRMLHLQRTVDAQGKVHVGHLDTLQSGHTHTHAPRTQEKPNE